MKKLQGRTDPRIFRALSILAMVVYIVLAWNYANQQSSILDEGAYLLKGLYFVEGRYDPYQPNGPRTNHMPLAFLIPGFAQSLFGPGLRSARLLSVALGSLSLVFTWFGIRRNGGEGWAAAAVWLIAANPAVIKMYSTATSQPLVFFMLSVVLAFGLGKDRSLRELMLASVTAGFLSLTRINLSPVLPVFVLYVFWQYGRKAGMVTALSGFGVALVLLAVFWPEILYFLATWVPASITPFLDVYRPPREIPLWDPQPDLANRVISFFTAFRFHFSALMGLLFSWLLVDRSELSRPGGDPKSLVFISVTFLILFLLHFYAALVRSYCVYCFPVYLSFFTLLGIYFLALSFGRWKERSAPVRQWIGFGIFILLMGGIGFSAFEILGEPILTLQIPRFKDFSFQSGSIELWGLLNNRFGWSYAGMLRTAPAVAGILIGAFVVLAFIGIRFLRRRSAPGAVNVTSFRAFAVGIIVAGAILSPTPLLGGGYSTYDCQGRLIDSYEAAGEILREWIPPGSQVFWQGTLSAAPLLYVPDITILPGQINLDYTFRLSGDPDDLEAFGLWNEPSGLRWLAGSDAAIVSDRYLKGWVAEAIEMDRGLKLVHRTQPVETCNPETRLNIFLREP